MLIAWNSVEGKKRLFESKYAQAFFALAHLFERQTKPTYCGIASAVMALNALRCDKKGLKLERRLDVKIPESAGGGVMGYNAYTQLTFHTPETERVKKRKAVEGRAKEAFDPGLSLTDLAATLRLHMCEVKTVSVTDSKEAAVERFRKDLMAYMNERQTFLIAHFDSQAIGREGGGHFSPVAAYHPPTDSCLVMDVAGHKQPWFWVEVSLLHRAMCTRDGDYTRGYLIVSDRLD